MSVNGARGEVGLIIGGVERRLCLTLGALAEIETAFGCSELSELNVRMRALSAQDLLVVIAAMLRGGGEGDFADKVRSSDLTPGAAAKAVAEAFQLGLAG